MTATIASLEVELQRLRAELRAAERRDTFLRAQLGAASRTGSSGRAGIEKVAQPALPDVSGQLPRSPGSMKVRALDQIQYLVFNHTAVDPSVGVERVAQAHQRKWGAILHQYFITAGGDILQTNPLEQVVDLSQPWIAQGINIAIAGDFTAQAPSPDQLRAAAHLSAWLMDELEIASDNVRGACDFIRTQSPGLQWNSGRKWRDLLMAGIAEFRESAPDMPTGDKLTLTALQAKVRELEGQLAALQAQLTATIVERDKLASQIAQPPPEVADLLRTISDLREQVLTLNADKAGLTTVADTLRAQNTTLAKQVSSLTAQASETARQLAAARSEQATLSLQNSQLQAEIKAMRESMGIEFRVPAPRIVDISGKLPVHERERYDTRKLAQITHIAIHHSAATASVSPEAIAKYHVSKDWPGIGYHFYIMPDGAIYQTNKLETVSYQVYDNNDYTIGICLAGIFNESIPTQMQIAQTGHLVAWLMQQLHIGLDHVLGHKEYPNNSTACPGTNWLESARYKALLTSRIRSVLAGKMAEPIKPIEHYVLFWGKADSWAHQDWQAATDYMGRFRATAGFSPEEAASARYVTIVGGPAGVSTEVERALAASDCRVDRLSGVDFADTKRMLDELVRSGRRFRSFDS
jgi:hypothetical protein